MEGNKSGENKANSILLAHNIFIKWKPDFDLGIPIIDEQHRGIVTTINSLFFGMQNKYIREMFTSIVDMMYDYTHIHFKIEEDFLEKIDFPNAKKHHELHLELSSRLTKLGKNSILDKDSYQLLDFLKKWWINHICCEDLHFRDHLFKEK